MHSLSRRLIVSIAIPLVLFFGITIAVLDVSFRHVSDHVLRAQLRAHMLALIAAIEPQANGAYAPAGLSVTSRLNTPGSGLYAQIRTGSGVVWRSPSTLGVAIDFGGALPPGPTHFWSATLAAHSGVALASRGISFEAGGDASHRLTVSVAMSLASYEQQLWAFRSRLFGWFLGLTLLLLATLAVVLRWVLAPVRRLEREIHAVEAGTRDGLGGAYPRELTGVTTHLNALLDGERKRVARYRDTLGNLAHGLKTPLAVMRSALATHDSPSAAAGPLNSEIDRMSDIIEHQLKRAAASGGALLGQAPVDVAPIAADLRAALNKVYAGKDLIIELAIAPGTQFAGDRGDLTELLGNLLDNACKWCRGRVRLSAASDASAGVRERLRLEVEDDGPGISDADRGRVFERGARGDERTPGHGLGLAMVRDTVDLYGGRLTISRSDLGGACIALRLPGR